MFYTSHSDRYVCDICVFLYYGVGGMVGGE